MLPEAPRTSTVARVPSGPHGQQYTEHHGWDISKEPPERQAGYAYPAPEVACASCDWDEAMFVVGCSPVGGRYSVIWTLVCLGCSARWEYPATNFHDATEAPESAR